MPVALPEIFTYQDAVDYLADTFRITGKSKSQQLRAAKRAVDNALRRLPGMANWDYFDRRASLATSAKYDTGTITYDHTGGSNENEVTLASGTWPSWAANGRIEISSVRYDVLKRVSDSVITLSSNYNPGADVAAGTSYTLFRDEYTLPDDFAKIGELYDVAGDYTLTFVHPDEAHDIEESYGSPQQPSWYTIRASNSQYGRKVLVLSPAPSTARTYSFIYVARPLPIRIYEFAEQTVTITSNTTATFATGVVLPTDCAGAVIRLSAASDEELPTSRFGRIDTAGQHTDNYRAQEALISTRDSDTTATLDRSLSNVSTVRYMISDPIDIEPGSMWDALLALAESEYSRWTFKNRHERRERQAQAMERVREAMQYDYPSRAYSVAGEGRQRRLRLRDFANITGS